MPEKVFFFLQRAPQLSHEEFCRRYLDEHAPLVLKHCPRLLGYAVNLIDERDAPDFADLVSEMWFDSWDDFADEARLYGSPEGKAALERSAAAMVGSSVAYRVDERVQRDYERTWAYGEPSPGRKMLSPLRHADGLSHEQFVDHWRERHVPLALKHVLGMGRYVTNVVVEPLTPDAPEIDGIVEVHYVEKRRFDSPEGEAIMMDDVRQFLSPPTRHRATEYVLKG